MYNILQLGVGSGEVEYREVWIKIILLKNQPLLLKLVKEGVGGGENEGVGSDDTFLWPFLDTTLTIAGE